MAGVVLGAVGAFEQTRVMQSLLFHVSATDPVAYMVVGVLFVVVALAASYFPARRAARVDPVVALRVG
jgi:putative ABC transport system permease protein